MSDQLRRQIEILRLLPRQGLAKSTADILRELKERSEDFGASKRTIERDLANLANTFPAVVGCDAEQGDNNRTNYWYIKSLKGVLPETLFNDRDAALALAMLKQQAYNRLPSSVLNRLGAIWDQASETAESDQVTRKWMQLIQYLPDPMRPESPPIIAAVQATIEEALDTGQGLNLTLQTLTGQRTLEKLLPIRLLLQEEILYLLAEYPGAETIEDSTQLLPLHRISEARTCLVYESSSLEPDLAQAHALGMDSPFKLIIRVNPFIAEALFNRPIGRSQTMTPDTERPGWFLVTTYIDQSPQLKRWLDRRVGSELEIIEPAGLV